MTNPQYKFFRDELKETEVVRYSNGKEVSFEPSTPELKEGVERIVKELEARGFRRTSTGSQNSVSFSRPEFCKAAYVGTFVNPYSFNDKVWCWKNRFAVSEACITIREVYRHNGASRNASLSVSVGWVNFDRQPKYTTEKWLGVDAGKVNDYGVEIPFTYDAVYVGGIKGNGEEIRKFKPTVSDRVLKNILDKAEEVINTVELFDPSVFEVDAKDYHESTEKEWKAWKEEEKAKA